MRSNNLMEDQNDLMLAENGQHSEQKNQNQHHKPFLATTIHKIVPIGFDFHQIEVPEFISPPLKWRQTLDPPQSKPVYLRSRIQEDELEEYLSFAENYYEQKSPDYFSQGIASRDRTRSKAMQFLHQMNYNYVKAKFYILFPYYLTYNNFRPHLSLKISDAEMNHRINQHLQSLKSTKEKQLQRWVGTVQSHMQGRIHLAKLNSLIEVAKQNKFEIPESIKEHVQRSIKIGRQIKKSLHSTKLPLDKLILKQQSLLQCKIITSEMVQFQQTVKRCQQWIVKQQNFQETYFIMDAQPRLKDLQTKIQYRSIQLLVNQFNNLPLIYQNYQKTTGVLFYKTQNLLQKLPSLTKTAKTRTSQTTSIGAKIPIQSLRQYIDQIHNCPVQHEQFILFQSVFCQNLQWLQRIGMWLQDQKSQKSLKVLNTYSKVINDNPISNKIQSKLQSRLQYYQIMQKVKKDISNPAKYEHIKDLIKKLKQKGQDTCQYNKLQSKIVQYMSWYQNQQILSVDRMPNSCFQLITKQKNIKNSMISCQSFEAQINTARVDLVIPEQVLTENQKRVVQVKKLQEQMRILNSQQEPKLSQIVQLVKQCVKNGLYFQQFVETYEKMLLDFYFLAQMAYLLISNDISEPEGQQFFFSKNELQIIIPVILDEKKITDIKEYHTKATGDEILKRIGDRHSLKKTPQYILFNQFMYQSQGWSTKAMQLIKRFKQSSFEVNIKELIEQSKKYLHSREIDEELNKLDIVLKWRQKISRKLNDNHINPFDDKDREFIVELESDLQEAQSISENGQKAKIRALQYYWKNGQKLYKILEKISNIQIQCTYKLSEMNKFCKQVDKQIQKSKLDDKIILNLRQQLQRQLLLSDQWKEKYLAIKRFQKKKLKKQDQQLKEVQIQIILNVEVIDNKDNQNIKNNQYDLKEDKDGIATAFYIPQLLGTIPGQKRKYIIRNGQFCWYFKLLLMVLQFYNGYHLKFAIQEIVRLKSTLTDIYRFILHYNQIMYKQDKTDLQLLALQAQGAKFPLFFRQTYILSKKNAYITSWKQLADSVLKSLPVLSMQLKARKAQQLIQLLQMKKMQKDDEKQQGRQQIGNKRKRKQNPFYSNQEMTLITQQTFGLKSKKKRKGNNLDQEYRNTAVASSAKKLARSQREQFQRAEALLSGQVPAELIHIDDPKQYCICRYGVPNENSIMIQCEYKCEEWFHIQCLGIKKHQTKNDMKLKCVGCKQLYDQQPQGYYFWDSHSKISDYAFSQIVEEGKKLDVQTSQMKKIQILNKKIQIWKVSVNNLLKKICQLTVDEIYSMQNEIYELYLHSLWLPTAHPQSAILKKLVLFARNQQ